MPRLSQSRYAAVKDFYRQRDGEIHQTNGMGTTILGGIVKARREAAGLKQVPFARAVGISQSKLNDIENGKTLSTNIRAETLFKLADYLNLHPRYLLTGTGPHQWSAADSEQEERLLAAFRELDQEQRAELVGRVLGMLDAKPKPTRVDNPYKGLPKPAILPLPAKKSRAASVKKP